MQGSEFPHPSSARASFSFASYAWHRHNLMQGPWSNSSYPLHKSHNNNGWRGFSCRGVLLPSVVRFHMRNVFWQRRTHVLRLVMWQDNNWTVYWLYNNTEQLHYCVLWNGFYSSTTANLSTCQRNHRGDFPFSISMSVLSLSVLSIRTFGNRATNSDHLKSNNTFFWEILTYLLACQQLDGKINTTPIFIGYI